MADRFTIRELIESWALWRDSGDWDRFATVWHDDGWMVSTWFEADASEFIARSAAGFENGRQGIHVLGGISIDLSGERAVSQTRMEIIRRASVHGVRVEVSCHGRFVDAWEKRQGRWGLVHRQPVYEMDRMTPVDATSAVELDPEVLAHYPAEYCNLAYLQSQQGIEVNRNLPVTRGPEIEGLMRLMAAWLAGAPAVSLRLPAH